ncbi:MAG: Holliday junction resolvase RuvX [Rhodobacteraceae bacterium]|nr:Holliday junction resolvase RuvX [Paracoccaceae bacterium]
MITEDTAEFATATRSLTALIALDLGTRTIGVAVSDLRRRIATPRTTIRRRTFTTDTAELGGIIADTGATGVVLGLPGNMDGTEGPRAQATRAFAHKFSRSAGLPILLWDERLSSVFAERVLLEADISRAKRAKVIDRIAAGIILQGVLDSLTHMGES